MAGLLLPVPLIWLPAACLHVLVLVRLNVCISQSVISYPICPSCQQLLARL